ncbi:MAG: type II secretion system protein [Planctomycetota bacterium]
MHRRQSGFTLIEILVVVAIIATLAGLVALLIPKGQFKKNQIACINNCRNIAALLIVEGKLPPKDGVNMLLWLVKKGDILGENIKASLFCPGDQVGWEHSGGLEAYKGSAIDLNRHEYDDLSSYAGRKQLDKACSVSLTSAEPAILVCDQDEKFHDDKGICVGMTDGSAKYRDKLADYEKGQDQPLEIGEASDVEELRCMQAD